MTIAGSFNEENHVFEAGDKGWHELPSREFKCFVFLFWRVSSWVFVWIKERLLGSEMAEKQAKMVWGSVGFLRVLGKEEYIWRHVGFSHKMKGGYDVHMEVINIRLSAN